MNKIKKIVVPMLMALTIALPIATPIASNALNFTDKGINYSVSYDIFGVRGLYALTYTGVEGGWARTGGRFYEYGDPYYNGLGSNYSASGWAQTPTTYCGEAKNVERIEADHTGGYSGESDWSIATSSVRYGPF